MTTYGYATSGPALSAALTALRPRVLSRRGAHDRGSGRREHGALQRRRPTAASRGAVPRCGETRGAVGVTAAGRRWRGTGEERGLAGDVRRLERGTRRVRWRGGCRTLAPEPHWHRRARSPERDRGIARLLPDARHQT